MYRTASSQLTRKQECDLRLKETAAAAAVFAHKQLRNANTVWLFCSKALRRNAQVRSDGTDHTHTHTHYS